MLGISSWATSKWLVPFCLPTAMQKGYPFGEALCKDVVSMKHCISQLTRNRSTFGGSPRKKNRTVPCYLVGGRLISGQTWGSAASTGPPPTFFGARSDCRCHQDAYGVNFVAQLAGEKRWQGTEIWICFGFESWRFCSHALFCLKQSNMKKEEQRTTKLFLVCSGEWSGFHLTHKLSFWQGI